MEYIKRIVDDIIELKLQVTGGIVIRGPKWCGKTRTAMEFAKSNSLIQTSQAMLEQANQLPQGILQLLR